MATTSHTLTSDEYYDERGGEVGRVYMDRFYLRSICSQLSDYFGIDRTQGEVYRSVLATAGNSEEKASKYLKEIANVYSSLSTLAGELDPASTLAEKGRDSSESLDQQADESARKGIERFSSTFLQPDVSIIYGPDPTVTATAFVIGMAAGAVLALFISSAIGWAS